MALDYKQELKIDQNALDIEWREQPEKISRWGEAAAQAHYLKDKAKEKLDLVKAQVSVEIRKNAGKDVREGELNALVLQDPRYVEQSEIYLLRVKEARVMDVASTAFEHRRRALDNITKLFLANYYAEDVKPPKAASKAFTDNDEKRLRQTLGDQMNQKKLNR